jgi:hypothetical protein
VSNHPLPRMSRVSRRHPCPVCGRHGWCGFSEDGARAVCMRVSDGAVAESKNGGFLHILRERERDFTPPVSLSKPRPCVAPIERRHTVYTALLDGLTLSGRHADDLLRRGLSDTEAARNLYASTPGRAAAKKLCAEMSSRFDLSGVPGFFRSGGAWRLNVGDWHQGFFVPVRDAQGRIQAMQIRRDAGEPRYTWLSSADKPGGASCGSPVHFARPWRATSTGEAIISEGALKASVVAEHLDACTIAIAGVGSFRDDFGHWLLGQLPALRAVLIGFDSDWQVKREVERAMLKLAKSLDDAGLAWDVARWDVSLGKGLDDFLMREEGPCKY